MTLTAALGHLLYLYRYDEALGVTGRGDIGILLAEAFRRGLWLLDGLGAPRGLDRDLLRGIANLMRTHEDCAARLGFGHEDLIETLRRVGADGARGPLLRGAANGALWTLGEADADGVRAALRSCADPARLGDFLTGLFALAREAAQRHPALLRGIDDTLMDYDDPSFLEALPALRLAFSYFTPREKHHLARTLFETHGPQPGADGDKVESAPLPDLVVSVGVAVRALALEARLSHDLARYGLRGQPSPPPHDDWPFGPTRGPTVQRALPCAGEGSEGDAHQPLQAGGTTFTPGPRGCTCSRWCVAARVRRAPPDCSRPMAD